MTRSSLRDAASSGVLVGAVIAMIPWFSQPGRLVADTKLDLTVDPWGYLARAGTAWDSHAFFGQLQNQAYGYLFPMGPFFGIGHSLGVPGWMVQRAWWSVVLVVAFAGMYRLVRRWGLGGPLAATVAAILYAVSPRAMTVLGPISIEQWPSAVAPWIVLASLRLVAARGRARVGAFALVALACACVGGVNATASLAAFAVAGLFMITGRAERRVLPLWCAAVVAGTLWWSVPLVVLGGYAYPFLDFIETAAITTSVTSVPNVLRGASHWVGFVANGQAGGEWPVGAEIAYDRWLVVSTLVVAVIAVAAIARRDAWAGAERVRRFALVSLLVGAVAMCAGFGATLGLPFTGGWASQVRELLDGSLAALRNVHKLDPLVRVPVCLGIAVAVQQLGTRAVFARGRRTWAVALAAVMVMAVTPAIASSLAPRGAYDAIPDRWVEAAAQIDALAAKDGGSTLVAPATRFGEFRWGNTQGDPLEALASSPVVKRDAIPLGSPGAIRVMDALDGVLRGGAARPGLVDLLDRMGIGRVLVSHDDLQDAFAALDPGSATGDARAESVLRRSGLVLAGTWGAGDERLSVWSTGRTVEHAELLDAGSLTGLTGGPEAVVDLSAHGLLGASAPGYVVGTSDAVDPARVLQTDTLRRRALDVASTIENQYSATLPAERLRRRADFAPAETSPGTTRAYAGLRDVTASSSSADPGQLGYRSPAFGVASAFDGDDDTVWLAAADDEDPRIGFTLPDGARVGRVTVQLADLLSAGTVRAVELVVDGTVMKRDVLDQSETVTFDVGRKADRMEVALVPGDGAPRYAVGIASIGVEGVDTAAELRLPPTTARTSAALVSRDPWSNDTTAGRRDDSRVLDRVLTTDADLPVAHVLVRTRSTPQVERLLDGWAVTGPRVDRDMRTRPGAALDDDRRTRWTVGYESPDPTLRIDMGTSRTLSGLSLARVARGEPRIRAVRVRDVDTGEQRQWTRSSPTFAPLTARRVELVFDLPERVVFPVRMPDVSLIGAEDAPASRTGSLVRVGCDDGATVQVGPAGQVGRDSARYVAEVTRADLLAGAVVEGTRCTDEVPVVPGGGEARVVGVSSQVLDVWSIAAGDLPTSTASTSPDVTAWSDSGRRLDVPPAPQERVLVWHEGFNPGWRATLDGRELATVEIDGWRQGFVVPAGAGGEVAAHFAPDRTYRAGLVGGGALALLALVLAVVLGRGRTEPIPQHGSARRGVGVLGGALAVAALTVIGGVGGLVIGVLAHAVPRRWRWRAVVVAGVLLVVAVARWPVTQDSWTTASTQALGLVLLALAAAAYPVEHRSLDEAPGEIGGRDGHHEGDDGDGQERALEQVQAQHREDAEQDR